LGDGTMKTKIFLLAILLFSEKLIAQSTTIEPAVFRLSTVTTNYCPASDKGKIYYNTIYNKTMYCAGTNTANFSEDYWQGNSDIYYLGKISLSLTPPTYELEVIAARATNLIVDGNIGFNTTTPTEKLELIDKEILIKSTADNKHWSLGYIDTGDRFEVREKGFAASMFATNGGNIGIGNLPYSDKLLVQGDVSYNGNLTVEGQGLLQNTSATQLRMFITTVDISSNSNLVAPNSCQAIGFSLGNNIFTTPPAVSIGQKTIGNSNDEKIIMTIEGVTSLGGKVRFCNNTATNINISSHSYSLVAIGQ
jgi:hypothetical protein